MEKHILIEAMKSSISEVFEKMFFLPLEYCKSEVMEDVWGSGNKEIFASKLNFSGPFSGHFRFIIPGDLALSITSSFMGMTEDDISQDMITGTVKEIVNMLAGNTFSAYDEQAVFSLDIPEIDYVNKGEREDSGYEEKVFVVFNSLDSSLIALIVSCNP